MVPRFFQLPQGRLLILVLLLGAAIIYLSKGRRYRSLEGKPSLGDSEKSEKTISEMSLEFQKTCDPRQLLPAPDLDSMDMTEALKELLRTAKEHGQGLSDASVECPRKIKLFKEAPEVPVGLISYPGSGNTWTRKLLQELTGFATGSVFNETLMKANGFPGEGRIHDVVAVKTHEGIVHRNHTEWSRIILLTRNPYDAIPSYFKYEQAQRLSINKTREESDTSRLILLSRNPYDAVASSNKYKHAEHTGQYAINKTSEEFHAFVANHTLKWPYAVRHCLLRKEPQLVIHYEDLKDSLLPQLLKFAHFLQIPGSLDRFSFCCALQNSHVNFHLHRVNPNASLYSKKMKKKLNDQLNKLSEEFRDRSSTLANKFKNYTLL